MEFINGVNLTASFMDSETLASREVPLSSKAAGERLKFYKSRVYNHKADSVRCSSIHPTADIFLDLLGSLVDRSVAMNTLEMDFFVLDIPNLLQHDKDFHKLKSEVGRLPEVRNRPVSSPTYTLHE
jgi:hypothetical protein